MHHPSAIADALEAMPWEQRTALWRQISAGKRGEILTEVHGEVRRQLIEASTNDELCTALAGLQSDELADLDADLPAAVVGAMLDRMDSERRRRYESVRSYPDDSAGGLMDVDAIPVSAGTSLEGVMQGLRRMREASGTLPEHFDSLMVVDEGNHFLGVLRLSDVVSLPLDTLADTVMDTNIPGIPVLTPSPRVVQLFEDFDLLSTAVVSEDGRLLGRITVDDVIDVLREHSEHTLMSQAGMHEDTDMFAPVLKSAGRRTVWLAVNLVNAFVAAFVIGLFSHSIEQIVALAVLMPVVASMGGVAGNQSLTLVTRGIALDQVKIGNSRRLLTRELTLGLINGVFWAIVVAVVITLWFDDGWIALVFAMALMLNLLVAAITGTAVPLVLNRLGIDPALAGGVLLMATTDVVGFASFLGLATLILL